MSKLKALIFDCDGVLAETEKDGHRVAFNKTFEEKGIDAKWSVKEYGKLLKISGGKERMKYFFGKTFDEQNILELHKRKTQIFAEICLSGFLQLRPGIERIIKEAYGEGVLLFICSTAHIKSVTSLLESNLGQNYLSWFTDLFCGDVVKSKKPAPDVYNLVKERYSLRAEECVVIEDTNVGLLSAKAAGMRCIITPSYYSFNEDFTGADMVISSLGEPQSDKICIIKMSPKLKSKLDYISIKDIKNMV